MGDAVDDVLAGTDADGLMSAPAISSSSSDSALAVPSWGTSSTSAPPINVSQGNASTAWGNFASTFASGLLKSFVPGLAPKPAAVSHVGAPSSGPSTALIVGGVAGVGVLAYLLLRRRSA